MIPILNFALALQRTPPAGEFSAADVLKIVGLGVLAIFLLVFLVIFMKYANLYVRSITTNAGIGLFDMFAMSLRKVNPSTILDAKIMLVQARIEGVERRDLEAHLLAGGRVPKVVTALISAHR